MMRVLVREWGIDFLAFGLVAGVTLYPFDSRGIVAILAAGILFACGWTILRPFLWLVSCPLSIVTVGPLLLCHHALLVWVSTVLAGPRLLHQESGGLAAVFIAAFLVSVIRRALIGSSGLYRSWTAQARESETLRRLEERNARLEQQRDRLKQLAEEWERALSHS
jgi:uncharacterized membrane protein YvlD (DUF360 family)